MPPTPFVAPTAAPVPPLATSPRPPIIEPMPPLTPSNPAPTSPPILPPKIPVSPPNIPARPPPFFRPSVTKPNIEPIPSEILSFAFSCSQPKTHTFSQRHRSADGAFHHAAHDAGRNLKRREFRFDVWGKKVFLNVTLR